MPRLFESEYICLESLKIRSNRFVRLRNSITNGIKTAFVRKYNYEIIDGLTTITVLDRRSNGIRWTPTLIFRPGNDAGRV